MINTNKKDFIKYLLSAFLIVSLTTISIQAWNGLTASEGDKLDYDKWNQLVNTVQSGIHSGAVVAFNLENCPNGWSEYTTARGRTIIGAGNGAGSITAVGNTGGEKSAPAISIESNLVANVSGTIKVVNGNVGVVNPISGYSLGKGGTQATIYTAATANDFALGGVQHFSGPVTGTISGGGTAPDNMQPYVSSLYCQKN